MNSNEIIDFNNLPELEKVKNIRSTIRDFNFYKMEITKEGERFRIIVRDVYSDRIVLNCETSKRKIKKRYLDFKNYYCNVGLTIEDGINIEEYEDEY
jgi:hypothetical protein